MVGQPLQHLEAGFLFAADVIDVDDRAGLVLAIGEGTFQRQVDETGRGAVIPDGNLAQQQRLVADTLQGGDQVAQTAPRLVELVDEQQVRHARIRQPLQDGLQHHSLAGIGFAHHDGGVDAGQHRQGVAQELDGARAIQEGEILVQIARGQYVHLHAHLAGAGFGTAVAQAGPRRHRTLARHSPGDHGDGFQQRGLAAAMRTQQGDGARPGFYAVGIFGG